MEIDNSPLITQEETRSSSRTGTTIKKVLFGIFIGYTVGVLIALYIIINTRIGSKVVTKALSSSYYVIGIFVEIFFVAAIIISFFSFCECANGKALKISATLCLFILLAFTFGLGFALRAVSGADLIEKIYDYSEHHEIIVPDVCSVSFNYEKCLEYGKLRSEKAGIQILIIIPLWVFLDAVFLVYMFFF